MKKVVFKGIVNDKEFDNISDYNEEMSRLVGEGAPITASSTTQIVDEPEEVKEEPVAEEQKVERAFNKNYYLPFFNCETNGYYLDSLVYDDDKLNEKSLELVNKSLSKSLNDLKEDLNGDLNLDMILDFINDVKNIRKSIYDDKEDNELAIKSLANDIESLTKEIEEDKKRLTTLHNAKPVIDALSTYYDKAFELLKGYLFGF